MTIQDLGSLGELVAAIATVATLVYLAIQIRQNTAQLKESVRATHVSAMDKSFEAFSSARQLLAQPGLADLYVRGLESYPELSETEKVQFRAIIEEYLFAYVILFDRIGRGAMQLQTGSAPLGPILSSPGGSQWWAERKTVFPPAFVEEIERRATRVEDEPGT